MFCAALTSAAVGQKELATFQTTAVAVRLVAHLQIVRATFSKGYVVVRFVAARIRRRYGSINIADGDSRTKEPSEGLRYYQYTLLSRQGQPETSRGKKRKRVKQAADESESVYLFHVLPALGAGT